MVNQDVTLIWAIGLALLGIGVQGVVFLHEQLTNVFGNKVARSVALFQGFALIIGFVLVESGVLSYSEFPISLNLLYLCFIGNAFAYILVAAAVLCFLNFLYPYTWPNFDVVTDFQILLRSAKNGDTELHIASRNRIRKSFDNAFCDVPTLRPVYKDISEFNLVKNKVESRKETAQRFRECILTSRSGESNEELNKFLEIFEIKIQQILEIDLNYAAIAGEDRKNGTAEPETRRKHEE